MVQPTRKRKLVIGAYAFVLLVSVSLLSASPSQPQPLEFAQVSTLSSWRPYNNPDRLISIGMNKGQVLAIAGKPDHDESYYQGAVGRFTSVSDWYYIRSGFDPQTTVLKFVQGSLVSIISTPTP